MGKPGNTELAREKQFRALHWASRPIGVDRNEKAAELARKEAATSLVELTEPVCALGVAFFKGELKKVMLFKRNRLYRYTEGLTKPKELLEGLNFMKFQVCIGFSKTILIRITGFLTGPEETLQEP